jgi:serine/threonine protein kinase/Flp pilus assembly protein TadD
VIRELLSERLIFETAIEKSTPAERANYLDLVCGQDSALRKDVEELLAAHERLGSLPPGDPNVASEADDLGTLIGPYRLLEKIGEGGFGLVFLAEQTEPVRRRVALKIIKPGMDSHQIVARFEAERQALALMDHPNISRVFDAGTAPSGRPYFVMELVEGVPITEYCARNELGLRQRLELFALVCQAVQHAHLKGVIHRDLKPSNVLVADRDPTPAVKVIDFGLAKAIGQESLTEKTLVTGAGQLIGTPLYMSPEHAGLGGLDVDTRSDIYSLGVLLYELLTGTTPFDKERLRQVDYDEMRRIIREEDPPGPSSRLATARPEGQTQSGSDTRRLSQLCRGELDWIVMKALEKDRNRRYETASAFAADVDRYLHDEPVQACPPSTWYRFHKFVRKNQRALSMAGVVGSAVVVALIAVAGSVGWIASERASREAALEAEVNRARDEASDLIARAKWPEAVARVQRAREVLLAAGRRQLPERLEEIDRDLAMARRLEEIYARPQNHDFFTGENQDQQYAEAFKHFGIDIASLPVAESARQVRERSIRPQLVLALDLWANMRYRAGTPVPDWQRLLEIAGAADDDPWRCRLREICRRADRRKDREEVAALVAAADVTQMPPASLYLLARVSQAFLQDGKKALDILRQAQKRFPDDLWLNFTLASACMDARPPQYDEAVRFYSIALALRPDNLYLLGLVDRARMLKGDAPDAIAALSQAIARKADNVDALWLRGEAFLKAGAPEQGLADFSRLIELAPASAVARRERGVAHDYLKQWNLSVADYSEALKLDQGDMLAWHHRGYARAQLHDWDGALADLSVALRLDGKWPRAWIDRGEVYVERGQWALARADFEKALEISPDEVMHWFCASCLYVRCADIAGYRRLAGRMNERFGHSQNVSEIAVLAHVWTLAAQPESELSRVRQLAQLRMELSDVINHDPGYRAFSTYLLGLAYYRVGAYDKATALLEQAARGKQTAWSVYNFLVLAMAHQRLMHVAEARQWFGKAQRLIEQEAGQTPKGSFTPPNRIWWDWLCVQILRDEAATLPGMSER